LLSVSHNPGKGFSLNDPFAYLFERRKLQHKLLFGIKRIDFRLQIRRITLGKFGHGIDAGSFEQPRIRRADTLYPCRIGAENAWL